MEGIGCAGIPYFRRQHVADGGDTPAGLVAGDEESGPHFAVAEFVASVGQGDGGREEANRFDGDGSLAGFTL